MAAAPVRIAMWSGPRNISTAMMRAWENRPDTVVSDEPLYAAYLSRTGLDHPMREEILHSQSTSWCEVVARLTGPVPKQRPIWYQKHMTHHLLPEMDRDWVHDMHCVFLIRDPREVLLSYIKKRTEVTIEDLGLPQQAELFDRVADRIGVVPPVFDAADVLRDPQAALKQLCETVGVSFDHRMLCWPPGRRASDGVWAPHWYESVERSTGWATWQPRTGQLPSHLDRVLEESQPYYDALYAHRIEWREVP